MVLTDVNSEDRPVQEAFAGHLPDGLGWDTVPAVRLCRPSVGATCGLSWASGALLRPGLVWLPIVDAYRTFCIAPPPEVRVCFESLRNGQL
jgi:hypothetical protein